MTSQEIKNLQTQLNAKGANLKVDGILGPKTQAAMTQFTTAAQSPTSGMDKQSVMALQQHLNANGANLVVDGILGPKTTAAMNSAVTKAVAAHPATKDLVKQNDPNKIVDAYMSGDWTGVNDVTGKPFSDEQQQAAVAQAEQALAPGYKAQESYDTANTESALANDVSGYNSFLKSDAQNFQTDKTQQDQSSADNGVLFAGSRIQKLNDLRTAYADRATAKAGEVGANIADTARDFQYKYGNPAAQKLSSYYGLGGQTYNPNVVRGGVAKTSTLSSVYNPNQYKFQGTAPVANKAVAQVRAGSLLANRTNKIVPYGYKNQF